MAITLPPYPLNANQDENAYRDWSIKLRAILTDPSNIQWSQVSKTGSNLSDLATRLHSSLQSLQGSAGPNYYHAASKGTAVLVAGTVTVADATVGTGSIILVTCQTPRGTPGFLRISARTAGVNFTILSSSGTDTSTVGYAIIN